MLSMSQTGTTTDVSLPEQEIFELLANRRRRFTIHALKRAGEAMDVAELSTRITAWETGTDPDTITYDDRRNVHTVLTRTHLPKLDEHDVVEYDAEAKVVEPTPALEDLDVYIEVLRGREIPWSMYYLGLSGVAAALLLAVAVGVPGLALLEPLDVSVFTVTAFAVSAATHYYYGERARLGNEAKPPELRDRQ
ncbi:transcriptional regulator [Halorubrum salipaludis]|uniref:Transcriptional regulator n=1 Tax=Halorubrum salipaludis TaxID=2032630 RepID=A0A2A2FD07_9EURY|nr:transcriptional regulator [Halorubrum salipaludis]PAU82848.1 transcriptional regulator [Halorubrum salipaludis]